MRWMAWTLPSALFFAAIALLLLGMTLWELRVPTNSRRGLLPMATTRGDRLFISLLSAAFLHLLAIGMGLQPLWWASAGAAVWALLLLRWG